MKCIGTKLKSKEVTDLNTKNYPLLSVKLLISVVSLGILVLTIWASFHLMNLNTNYSISAFFPQKHELLTRDQKTKLEFQLTDQSPLVIILKRKGNSPQWLEPKSLVELNRISELFSKWSGVKNVLSIANIEGAIQKNRELLIGEIYENLPRRDWISFTKKSGVIYPQLISTDLKSTLLLVDLAQMSLNDVDQLITKTRQQIKKRWPHIQIEIGGTPAVQASFAKTLFEELRILLLFSVVVFCAIFYFFIRGWQTLVFTGSVLICANIMALGVLGYLQVPFSIIMSTMPIIISISVISLLIHTLHRWAEVLAKNIPLQRNRYSLAWDTLKEMFLANFLGSVTTSIGFFTLTFTESPLISQYGYSIAAAVGGTWIFSQLALLVYMPLLQPKLSPFFLKKSIWTLMILKYRRGIFVSVFISTILFIIAGTRANFSTRLFDDLPQNNSARKATETIDEKFGGTVPLNISLEAKNAGFWLEPKNLTKMNSIVSQFRNQKAIGSIVSAIDFLGERVPKTRAATAETQFLFSMAENDPLKNYLTLDGQSIRLSVKFKDRPSIEIENARKALYRSLKKEFPSLQIRESGFAVTSHSINKKLALDLVSGFWHSIVLVGLLLVFVFRSVRWAFVACLPNLIPPAVLIGSLALFKTPIKPGVALIFSIALGLAFNNTVYLLSRLKKIRDEKNLSFLPLRRALLQEGNPCLFETSIMLSGFLIFTISSFSTNRIFGVYMVVSILAGAIADLFFLPSLLKLFPNLLIGTKLYRPPVSDQPSTSHMSAAASLVFAILLFLPVERGYADNSSEQAVSILRKAQKLLASKDDQAQLQMKVIEANGTVQIKKIYLESLRDESFYLLAKILAPMDIKNTAFLAQMTGGEESQWLYLPSSGQVRRIVSSKKTAGVLGSELTTEDLNPAVINGAKVKLIKSTKEFYLVETTPPKGSSKYSHAIIAISKQKYLPVKTNYYIKSKLAKTVEFQDYKPVGNKIWRAQKITIKNLANRRATELKFSNFKVNAGLTREDFSTQRLKDLD